jgi:phosphatidylserine decarboxylase
VPPRSDLPYVPDPKRAPRLRRNPELRALRFAREAWPVVLPFPLVAALLQLSGRRRLAALTAATGAAALLFFRDPERLFEGDAEILVAPADGLVTRVDEVEEPALGEGPFRRVVTFLSVFDVHLQRVPTTGVVASRTRGGRTVAAFRPDAGDVNEGHLTVVQRPDGDLIGIRQIAGLVARRVVCYLHPGQTVRRGEHLGIIKLGSRVDLVLPHGYEVLVERGDRVRGGATAVARPGP